MTSSKPANSDSPGGSGEPFFLVPAPRGDVPILIAVPHGGRDYPSSVKSNMREPEFASLRLEDRLVDRLAEQVAKLTGAGLLVAKTPRAMIDLNRSAKDVDWSMIADGAPRGVRHSMANRRSRSGLGLVPRRLPGLGEIWKRRIERSELDQRIAQVHRPYHAALSKELEAIRDRWGAALLLDFHSMPPLPRSRGDTSPAEFVIGDRFGSSCDAMLSARALNYFSAQDRPVAHNRPYSGGYVLERHGAPARAMHALQIEICRSTYLDSAYRDISPGLPLVAKTLAGLVRTLAHEVAQLGANSSGAMAAE